MLSRDGVGPLFASLAIGSAGIVCWSVWTREIDIGPIKPTPEYAQGRGVDTSSIALPRGAVLPPLESFQETLTRPLFSPTRRPLQAVVEHVQIATERAAATVDGIRVLGVVKSSDAPPQALLATPEAPRGAWLRIGEHAAGWQVVKIGDADVTIAADNREQTLLLYGEPDTAYKAATETAPRPRKWRNSR